MSTFQCQTKVLSIPREHPKKTKTTTLWLQEDENQAKEEETTQFPRDAGDTRTVTTLDENEDPDNDLVYWPGKFTIVFCNLTPAIGKFIVGVIGPYLKYVIRILLNLFVE